MSDAEIRLECLKLAVAAAAPVGKDILKVARDFAEFTLSGGHPKIAFHEFKVALAAQGPEE